MGMIIVTLVTLAVSLALIGGMLVFLRKQALGGVSAESGQIVTQIGEASRAIEELLQYKSSYASKGQLDYLAAKADDIRADLENNKAALKQIEEKLDGSQKLVEEKEAHQQELKSSREEDEVKLQELMESYDACSAESVALEQRLALSLKNLDSIIGQLQLTQSQKAVLTDLSNAATSAGSRLRDLITEYETLNERLKTLTQQHQDLEEEYTKLVEQQLGE